MEYTEAQQDRIEPNAGQAIPYEDYSVAAAGGVTTEDEEGDERVAMKHPKPPHHHQKKHQQRSSRKRSISSSSSDSSRSSSSSSILSSSSSDDSGSDGDNTRDATVKKKKRKKKEATRTGDKKRRKVGGRRQPQKATTTTESTTTDDGSINKLISVALRSQKKQYKNQIIQSVKSDLMNTLRSRIVQHQQRGKKKSVGGGDDEEGANDDVDATTTDTTDKQYRKRIKQAYRELEEGFDDAPKFNSKQHKKTIGSILSKLGEVNDIQLYRIPHIDKEMGLDKMDIGGNGGDTKLNKKMLSASPDKTIPEAVYAALKDAYSSCMLYKYFFRRIYPYLTVPYISK